MIRIFFATSLSLMLSLPALAAGSYANTSTTTAKSDKALSDGRTLADYNIQKE